jgi:hypothetical protein
MLSISHRTASLYGEVPSRDHLLTSFGRHEPDVRYDTRSENFRSLVGFTVVLETPSFCNHREAGLRDRLTGKIRKSSHVVVIYKSLSDML